jgi:hypothetical protein
MARPVFQKKPDQNNAMKTPLQLFCKSMNILLAVLLAGLGGGCDTIQEHSVTCSLWNDSRNHSYCSSSADPELKLFDSERPPDVLVEYNTVSGRHKGIQRRAFFLNANSGRMDAGKPPRFVPVRRDAGLTPIPVVKSVAQTKSPPFTNTVFAVYEGYAFTLYRPESYPQYCKLPNYPDGKIFASWQCVTLTPVAVTADAVELVVVVAIVGAVGAFVAACESNLTVRP